MNEHAGTIVIDRAYRTACDLIVYGQDVLAASRKKHNNEAYGALLTPAEFHALALALAQVIVDETVSRWSTL